MSKTLKEELTDILLNDFYPIYHKGGKGYLVYGSKTPNQILSLLKSRLLKALPKEKGLVEDFGEEGELNLTLTKIHSGYNQALKELREAIKGVLDGK